MTDIVNEKICRGFFQTLYWRRWFLAQRQSARSFGGVGTSSHKREVTTVPSIIVEESEIASPTVPRPALPSLDLTQMRNNVGAGYSLNSPTFGHDDRLPVYQYQPSDSEDESGSPVRTWSNIGGPESRIATSPVTSEL